MKTDNDNDDELGHRLRELYESWLPNDRVSLADIQRGAHRRRTRRRALVGGMLVVVAGAITSFVTVPSQGGNPTSSSTTEAQARVTRTETKTSPHWGDSKPHRPVGPHDWPGAPPPSNPNAPCSDYQKSALAQVWGQVPPMPHWIPDSVYANVDDLSSVWICGGRDPVFKFSTGITLSFQSGAPSDPKSWISGIQVPGVGRIVEVHGRVAYVIDPGELHGEGANGSVTWIDHGVMISIGGNGRASGDELLSVAKSLRISN